MPQTEINALLFVLYEHTHGKPDKRVGRAILNLESLQIERERDREKDRKRESFRCERLNFSFSLSYMYLLY